MFDMDSLDELDSVIKGGLAEGRWCFLHDKNNQSGLFGRVDREAVDYLASLRPAQVTILSPVRFEDSCLVELP